MSHISILVGVALASLPATALADGAVLAPSDLWPARQRIEARIRVEQTRDPAMFRLVARMNDYRPDGYRKSRARRPEVIGIRLRRLGPDARWAIADLVAFHAPDRGSASEREWRALQLGLVDAIGLAGDPELAPLLRAVFERSARSELQGAAAVGLGRLGDAELPALLAHARAGDERLVPSVRGLGASHRPEAVAALAGLLDETGDESLAAAIAGALGEAGSAWAWETGKLGSPADGDLVRGEVAGAIVRNYPRFTGRAAEGLEFAVRRVAHPRTNAMIASARARWPQFAARLDRLAGVLATH